MSYQTAEQRYCKDISFKQLVDALEHFCQSMELTPTEIREASMLASLHFEQKKPKNFIYDESLLTDQELRDQKSEFKSFDYNKLG
jgi:hypothetical protein